MKSGIVWSQYFTLAIGIAWSGAGIYYGAGASEALFCENEHVFVVGGGNSAGQAALEDSQKQTMSEYLIIRIRNEPRIEVLLNTMVTALHGERVLRAITLRNIRTGAEWVAETSRLFLCLGGVPHTQWAEEVGIVRDAGGYLVTGSDLLKKGERPKNGKLDRAPYYMETNLRGVFAAGDVRHGSVKRCASAVGEGAMAVTFIHRYLADG